MVVQGLNSSTVILQTILVCHGLHQGEEFVKKIDHALNRNLDTAPESKDDHNFAI